MEVIDVELGPLILVSESICIHPCVFHELVDELLLYTDGSVGAGSIDVPLKAVLFRMVLGHKVRVVKGLHC